MKKFSSSNSDDDSVCPLCMGLGFIKKDVPVGHPDFGKAIPCSCIAPKIQETRRRQMNALGALEMLNEMTFDNFRPDGVALPFERQRTLRAAYEAARSFAAQPNGWLLLTGSFGVGKTHLAAAIGNEVTNRGGQPIFVLVPDLLDHLRSSFSPASDEPFDELFERMKDAPLLILDDLGAESPTSWAKEKLFQLLNHRYLRRLPTVITSNRPTEVFEPRLRSRLMDYDLVVHMHILAADYRGGGYIDHMVELSELDLHADQTFETFRVPSGGREEVRQNLVAIRNAALDFAQQPQGWIAFLGRSGVGKTHLAAAIANHVRLSQPQVLFISIPRLLDHLRSSFSPHSTLPYDIRFEQIKQSPLLVLDDLRAQATSPWAAEKMFQLIDYRYLTRRPTVFTLSAQGGDLKELSAADPRIASRLSDESICQLCRLKSSGRSRGRQMALGNNR
ncbi:MAG TPA: ATP-binding protein [Caldilineae bacterium]|nr:ATP-binding protein [Caldilineae bacterium]